MPINRHPRGVPAGGQFRAVHLDEAPGVTLVPSDLDLVDPWDELDEPAAPAAAVVTGPPAAADGNAWSATPEMVAEAAAIGAWMDAMEGYLTIDQVETTPTAAEIELRVTRLGAQVDELVERRLEELAGGVEWSTADQQAEAIVDVLATIRPMGAGDVSVPVPIAPGSHKPAVRLLERNLWRFPTAWIQRNSIGKAMAVRTRPGGGAHFATRRRKWVTGPKVDVEVKSVFPPPEGTGAVEDGGVWTWTAKRSSHILIESPEMALPSAAQDPAWADGCASHEFCHRMESLRPGIPMVEQAFLDRRASRSTVPAGRRGERYAARQGDFVDPYVGKVYSGAGGNVPFCEVLSTGVESVHSGRWGSLLGLGGATRSDRDHRSFVLGVLAAA